MTSLPHSHFRYFLPLLVAAVGCLFWVLHTPPVGDLAAQQGWSQLVHRAGYVPWFTRWYGGVPVGGYSLVTPVLMAWLGVRTVGVIATLATAAVAVPLLAGARRPLAGATFFAIAAVFDLYSGRVTFALGGVVALAAVLAAERRRTAATAVLAAVATATSPVAGLFLLIALVVLAFDGSRRGPAVVGGAAVLVVGGVVAALFPVGGVQPFAFFVFRPAVEITLAAALLPVGRRVRAGLLLAALAIALSYFFTGPVGSNATRLAILLAVPALVAASRLPWVLLAPAVVVLGLWPWHQLHDDVTMARDASAQGAFTTRLTHRLAGDPLVRTQRVEVVEPRTHWPAAILANQGVTLARGWVRQVDEGRNPLFYKASRLSAATYRAFLDDHSVAYVAVPRGTPLDFGSTAEAALIGAGLDYLHPVWSDPHWTLYAVRAPRPVATGVARVTQLTDTGAVLRAARPGDVRLTLRWSRWLSVDGGSVHRDGDNVRLTLDRAGMHRLHGAWRWP